MSRRAIETALTDRLLSIDLPKAWLNQDFDPSASGNLPYLAVEMVRSATTDDTLNATAPIQSGRLIVTVVVQSGSGSGAADDYADTIAALYPMGERITATTGERITVLQPPHVREGIADGSYWRVAVSVSYQAA